MTLSLIIEVLAIISFISAVVKYVIINPIQNALQTMNESLIELKHLIKMIDKEQKDIDRRLIVVEEAVKSAHKRLDIFVGGNIIEKSS